MRVSTPDAARISGESTPADELRMVVDEASLWCVALDDGLYKEPVDLDFGRENDAVAQYR